MRTLRHLLRGGDGVDQCPVCEGADFYRRKDFDPKLGLAVIITGALISAGFYWFGLDLIAYGVLGAAALLDLIVCGRLKDITVCYWCHAEFRGKRAPTADVFDLHTADVLELEWARRLGNGSWRVGRGNRLGYHDSVKRCRGVGAASRRSR